MHIDQYQSVSTLSPFFYSKQQDRTYSPYGSLPMQVDQYQPVSTSSPIFYPQQQQQHQQQRLDAENESGN